MMVDFEAKMKQLQQSTLAQLRQRYAEVFGEQPLVTNNKSWLVKRIIWRMQALAEGDLSERARQRAAELANDADLRVTLPRVKRAPKSPPENILTDGRLPPAGTLLIRPYKGQNLQVEVLTYGFAYAGQR